MHCIFYQKNVHATNRLRFWPCAISTVRPSRALAVDKWNHNGLQAVTGYVDLLDVSQSHPIR